MPRPVALRMAEQAKILVAEAEENNLGAEAFNERWERWYTCGLCEQHYHGVVACALGWACWKTYVGRPERSWVRTNAMTNVGNGLTSAGHYEDALSVQEAELSMMRRLGASGYTMLVAQNNLAGTYEALGDLEKARRLKRDVYWGNLKLHGEEHGETLRAALNYSLTLTKLKQLGEAKALLRKTIPVARRVLGDKDIFTLKMRWIYAEALSAHPGATLDDIRESVGMLEELERTARRVMGGAHPNVVEIEDALRAVRAGLALRRELAEARRQVAELRRTAADAEAAP